jgi:hypothetical protein
MSIGKLSALKGAALAKMKVKVAVQFGRKL